MSTDARLLKRAEDALAENYSELWRLKTREDLVRAVAADDASPYQEIAKKALWIMAKACV
jgi:hypothetical protein